MRGIARMIEEDRYCIDVLTQMRAVRAALRRVEDEVLNDHVAHCVEGAIASGDGAEQRRKVQELLEVLTRRVRLADDRRTSRPVGSVAPGAPTDHGPSPAWSARHHPRISDIWSEIRPRISKSGGLRRLYRGGDHRRQLPGAINRH